MGKHEGVVAPARGLQRFVVHPPNARHLVRVVRRVAAQAQLTPLVRARRPHRASRSDDHGVAGTASDRDGGLRLVAPSQKPPLARERAIVQPPPLQGRFAAQLAGRLHTRDGAVRKEHEDVHRAARDRESLAAGERRLRLPRIAEPAGEPPAHEERLAAACGDPRGRVQPDGELR